MLLPERDSNRVSVGNWWGESSIDPEDESTGFCVMDKKRRNDIDWLRTLASYLVVLYHAAQFFDYQLKSFYKDLKRSAAMDAFTRSVHLWHMPLFFFLAGWSSGLSLGTRSPVHYLLERAQRLLLPLLLGMFTLCAAPAWVAFKSGLLRTSAGQQIPSDPSISFTSFLSGFYFPGGITWEHLWFLAYLFTFSLIYLPVFLSVSGFSRVKSESKWSLSVAANAPAVVLALVQLKLRDRWPGYQNLVDDWANFWFYSLFFVCGYLLLRSKPLEDHLRARYKLNGFIAFVACSCYVYRQPLEIGQTKADPLQHILYSLGAWYSVCFLLVFARRNFSDLSPPAFLVRNAFPVYVVHQVPLSLVADSVLRNWEASVWTKFVVSVLVTLFSSFAFLWLVVSRVGILQFLLGIKALEYKPQGKQKA